MENSHSTTGTNASASSSNTNTGDSTASLAQRRAFMRLALEERRRILAQQAEELLPHYQQKFQSQELETEI